MFVGHLAAALTAKRIDPNLSLGTATLAAVFADLLCFVFFIAGIESAHAIPGAMVNSFVGDRFGYSHSLVMDVLWATLFAGTFFLVRRSRRAAYLLFALLLSHWFLDVISHRQDMPLTPGPGPRLGFGLWNSIPAALLVEGGFWALTLILYVRATHARTWAGNWALWPVVVLLAILFYGNIRAGIPGDLVKAGINGLVTFSLIVAWAYWMNRARANGPGRTVPIDPPAASQASPDAV